MSFIQFRAPRRFEGLFLWELQRTLRTDQWIVNVATGVAQRSTSHIHVARRYSS